MIVKVISPARTTAATGMVIASIFFVFFFFRSASVCSAPYSLPQLGIGASEPYPSNWGGAIVAG